MVLVLVHVHDNLFWPNATVSEPQVMLKDIQVYVKKRNC